MEKMRRARINDSLNEMKSLVLDLLHKDVSICFYSQSNMYKITYEDKFAKFVNLLAYSDTIHMSSHCIFLNVCK